LGFSAVGIILKMTIVLIDEKKLPKHDGLPMTGFYHVPMIHR
jgi:hypothetical protein